LNGRIDKPAPYRCIKDGKIENLIAGFLEPVKQEFPWACRGIVRLLREIPFIPVTVDRSRVVYYFNSLIVGAFQELFQQPVYR